MAILFFMFRRCADISCSETWARPAQQHFSPMGAENLPLLKTVAVQWDFKLLEYSCSLDRLDSFYYFLCCAKASRTGCCLNWKNHFWCWLHVGRMSNYMLGGCSFHRPKQSQCRSAWKLHAKWLKWVYTLKRQTESPPFQSGLNVLAAWKQKLLFFSTNGRKAVPVGRD